MGRLVTYAATFALLAFVPVAISCLPGAQPPPAQVPTQVPTQAQTPAPTGAPATAPTPDPAPAREAVFEVGPLAVTPARLIAGQEATAEAEVTNVGEVEGTYTGVLMLDGKALAALEVRLAPGAKKTLSLSWPLAAAGEHTIELGGQTMAVKVLKPAEFRVGSLAVTPALVVEGDAATIKTDVSNVGDVTGTYTAILMVNGEKTETSEVVVTGGATVTVTFMVAQDIAGTYAIEVDGSTGTLRVARPAPSLGWRRIDFAGAQIDVPADWRFAGGGSVEHRTLPGVSVSIATEYAAKFGLSRMTLDEYLERTRERLSNIRPYYSRVIDVGSVRTAGRHSGYYLVSVNEGLKSRTLIYVHGQEVGYIVTAVADSRFYDVMEPTFEAIQSSFAVTGSR